MIKKFTSAAKAMIGAAALLLMFTTTGQAQEKDKAAEGAKAVTAQMKSQLTLSDSQYTKVLDVNRTYLQKANDSKAMGVTKVDKAKKMKALGEERDAKLKSVLTEDQYKIYTAGRAGNMKKLREFCPETK
jgi:hypothetical protein